MDIQKIRKNLAINSLSPALEDIEYPIKFTDLADDIQREIIELTGINDWADWDNDIPFAIAKIFKVKED